MNPVVIGNCELYLGDTKEILPQLAAQNVRAKIAVCDPPYLLTSGGCTNTPMRGAFSPDRYDNGGHLVACDIDWPEIMDLIFMILAERSHAYIMSNNRNIQPMLNAAEKAGFGFHNLLVWDKVSATPNRWYMKNAEFTGFFYKGKAYEINDCSSMSLIRYPHRDESNHPTEKPVSLMELYIRNSSQEDDTVIDPFMGSGSTGVAAVRAGRRFIGMELDAGHFQTACDRIRAEVERGQMAMF